jgi:Tol biopolymer transport system component
MWSGDAKTLFFMSDRSGAQNVWSIVPGPQSAATARPITTFTDGRVLWPTISKDGKTVAFERNFGIWTVDTASRQAREVPIVLRGAPAAAASEHRTFSDQFQELALSPDGKKAAFTVHGEVFSASARDGGDAVRITNTPGEEAELEWAPDSRRIAYRSDRNGTSQIFLYDFGAAREVQLTGTQSQSTRDHLPRFSPDGKWIAFERGSRELRVVDPVTKEERLVATGRFDTPPFLDSRDFTWSPDSRFLAYLSAGPKAFANVFVAAVVSGTAIKPGEGRQVSFAANTNAGSVSWSQDGTSILFVTGQRTEPGEVVRVDLTPKTPKFRETQFLDLFKDEQPKTPVTTRPSEPAASPTPTAPSAGAAGTPNRPVEIVFDDIRKRAGVLPMGLDVDRQTISPDGKTLLFTASAAGQQNLYVYPLDELAKEPAVARQLTSTAGAKRSAQFTPDGKDVVYLDRGRMFTVTIERREPKPVPLSAELDVDFSREKLEAFHQAWTYLRDQFFDDKMNGVDWNAVRATYEPRVAGARTPDEMRRIILLVLGELTHRTWVYPRRPHPPASRSAASPSTSIGANTIRAAGCASRARCRWVRQRWLASRPGTPSRPLTAVR